MPVLNRTSSETTPPLTDERLVWRAAFRATLRIALATRAGKHPRRRANKAMHRIDRISEEVFAGTLHPAIAALELLRVENRLPRITPPPATAAVAEIPSDGEWEPDEPVVLPYGPDPSLVLPMDLHDDPEDRAAARKAREARNA